jgi:hypothetical protein
MRSIWGIGDQGGGRSVLALCLLRLEFEALLYHRIDDCDFFLDGQEVDRQVVAVVGAAADYFPPFGGSEIVWADTPLA